jgi:hypothetical protein
MIPKTVNDLILTATLQVKTSIDQVVPLLEMGSKEDPRYQDVYTAFKAVQENLDKAVSALKVMK